MQVVHERFHTKPIIGVNGEHRKASVEVVCRQGVPSLSMQWSADISYIV